MGKRKGESQRGLWDNSRNEEKDLEVSQWKQQDLGIKPSQA